MGNFCGYEFVYLTLVFFLYELFYLHFFTFMSFYKENINAACMEIFSQVCAVCVWLTLSLNLFYRHFKNLQLLVFGFQKLDVCAFIMWGEQL